VRHSDVLIHLRAETNDTVIFDNEHSTRAIALRGRSCLPTDGTDKTAKLNDDRACGDRRTYVLQIATLVGRSRNDKTIKEISLHLNYNDVCDLIYKSKKIQADNKGVKI